MMVNSSDWLLTGRFFGQQAVGLLLLDQEVQSLQLSYSAYKTTRARLESERPADVIPELLHQAKVFVCAMRRFARLVETLAAGRSPFPGAQPEIKLAWKKKLSFLNTYIDPRNAIEHIDGEVKPKSRWVLTNIENDQFKVTEGSGAEVSDRALATALDLRGEIVAAALREGAATRS